MKNYGLKKLNGKKKIKHRKGKRYSLLIEGTAPAGGGAIFEEALCEILVEVVCQRVRDPLPRQNEDHQHGCVTVVPRPFANQTQQLLLLAGASDHLPDDFTFLLIKQAAQNKQRTDTLQDYKRTTYPFSYGTPLGALPFFPGVNNHFHPYCISLGTIPVAQRDRV